MSSADPARPGRRLTLGEPTTDARELAATLARLHEQLAGAHDLDDATLSLLRESAHEIEAALEAETPHEGPLEARLSELAGQLHESHPAVAEAVRRVVNALANLGI